jgi:hypothetical protein
LTKGAKLPLIQIPKGRIDRCRQQFGNSQQFLRKVWHSANAWCTEFLMILYLLWLLKQVATPEICLLLDQCGARHS